MLELAYFLWVKIFTGILLTVTFGIVPLVFLLLLGSAWPSEEQITVEGKQEVYLRPTPLRAFWLAVLLFVGVVAYGTQMNWIFNLKPSRVFDEVTHNFVEGFAKHKQEIAAKQPPVRTNLKTEVLRYELVGYNPPKHFYVTLEDVQTHQVFKSQYVSKHCNSHASNKIGDEYNIKVTTYTMSDQPGVVFFDFLDLYNVFCGE